MTTLQFFRIRLIRLHPLVLIGATLGLLGYLLDPFSKMTNRGPLCKCGKRSVLSTFAWPACRNSSGVL
jgi:hypothetical protein